MTTLDSTAKVEVNPETVVTCRRWIRRGKLAARGTVRLPARVARRVFSSRAQSLFVVLTLLLGAGLFSGAAWLQSEAPAASVPLQIVGVPASALRALIESPHFVLTDEHMQQTYVIESNQLRLMPLPEGGNIAGPAFALDGAPLGQSTVVVALHPGSPLRGEWAAATSRRVIAAGAGDPYLEITTPGEADPRLYRLVPG